jgi:hypothetical protein
MGGAAVARRDAEKSRATRGLLIRVSFIKTLYFRHFQNRVVVMSRSGAVFEYAFRDGPGPGRRELEDERDQQQRSITDLLAVRPRNA